MIINEIRKKAGLEPLLNESAQNLFGVVNKNLANKLKKVLIDVGGDKEYVNELFKKHIKVMDESSYNEFAKENKISASGVFNIDFGVDEYVSSVISDWGKEVTFKDDFKSLKV